MSLTNPVLISVHAEEAVGVNAIPEVLAEMLAVILDWDIEKLVAQENVVNHTGAGGFSRMARLAVFEGLGETIANLRGYIIDQGGIVIMETVLTGKHFLAVLALRGAQLTELQEQHGKIEYR